MVGVQIHKVVSDFSKCWYKNEKVMIVQAWHNNMSSINGVNFYFSISIDIDNCSPNPCNNGGMCTDGVDVYTCTCLGGFTGDNCEISKY